MKTEDLLAAAKNKNTELAVQQARFHYEVEYGGTLPCTADELHSYIAFYADKLKPATLEQRKTLIGRWHREYGYVDPTKTDKETTKAVILGMRKLSDSQQKQAKALEYDDLKILIAALDGVINQAPVNLDCSTSTKKQRAIQLQAIRNKALFLTAFMFGLRADSLCHIDVKHITFNNSGGTMKLFLPRSKTDKQNKGRTIKFAALKELCPIAALKDLIAAQHIEDGYLFTRIDQWGNVSDRPIFPNSLNKLLRTQLDMAGIVDVKHYSSHSFRRGVANWMISCGVGFDTLMRTIGWKDPASALRYLDEERAIPISDIQQAYLSDEQNQRLGQDNN